MRHLIWPIVGIGTLVIVITGFSIGIFTIKTHEKQPVVAISQASFKGGNEMQLDDMLDLISGLSKEVVALKEREASGDVVAEETKRLQSEIGKLRTAINALSEKKESELSKVLTAIEALMEKKEGPVAVAPVHVMDTRNEELEAKIKVLERKVKKLSKPKVEEGKATAPPLPPTTAVMAVMEAPPMPQPCQYTTCSAPQVTYRRSGIFGLGILGRNQ